MIPCPIMTEPSIRCHCRSHFGTLQDDILTLTPGRSCRVWVGQTDLARDNLKHLCVCVWCDNDQVRKKNKKNVLLRLCKKTKSSLCFLEISPPVIPRHSMWFPPILASLRQELAQDDMAFLPRYNLLARQWNRRVRLLSYVVLVPPSLYNPCCGGTTVS